MTKFTGFKPPEQNWSKLPHALIDEMPNMSGGELKVVLYILRHTWGYRDTEKRITIDEFINGRRRSDGERIDGGCGIASPTTVRAALREAEENGYIVVEIDDSDPARIKKFYALNMSEELGGQKLTPAPKSDDQKLTPGDQKLTPRGSKIDHRTEKETNERNSKKEGERDSTPSQQPEPAKPQTTPPPPPLAESVGDPYMDAAVNKFNRQQQGRAAHPGQIPMDDWNKRVPAAQRLPLLRVIAKLTGKTPMYESDDVKIANLLHEAAIKAYKWGYTPDDLKDLERPWLADWRSGGKLAGRIDQFEEFLSEQVSNRNRPSPTKSDNFAGSYVSPDLFAELERISHDQQRNGSH
jgi:DNA-binding PadR family transcriptional regulator